MFTDTAKKPLQLIANESTIYFPLLAVCSSSPRVKVFPILETEALMASTFGLLASINFMPGFVGVRVHSG